MPPLRLFFFFLALTFLVALVQFGLVTIAFEKLGLSEESAYLLLLCTLVGSVINLPLFTLKGGTFGVPKIPPVLMNKTGSEFITPHRSSFCRYAKDHPYAGCVPGRWRK